MPLQRLARYRFLRRIALYMLRVVGPGDIVVQHHWWPDVSLSLHAYKHRGYWFKGKRRERHVMERLAQLVKAGDTVIEIGAHIGYLSIHLRKLVGDAGRVVVFEPGPNNLPYLQKNTQSFSNVEIIEAACGDRDGIVDFWIESLSGQNNSLNKDYKNFQQNRANAFSSATMERVRVDMVQLDTFLAATGLRPALLKIDVEGAERLVLRGSLRCLSEIRPLVVVEVTENADEVVEIFKANGYAIHDRSHPEWICVPSEQSGSVNSSPRRSEMFGLLRNTGT